MSVLFATLSSWSIITSPKWAYFRMEALPARLPWFKKLNLAINTLTFFFQPSLSFSVSLSHGNLTFVSFEEEGEAKESEAETASWGCGDSRHQRSRGSASLLLSNHTSLATLCCLSQTTLISETTTPVFSSCGHTSCVILRDWPETVELIVRRSRGAPLCKCLHRRLQSHRCCPKAHQGNERAGQAFVRAVYNKGRI